MSPELVSILVLVVVFVIATTRSVNMGALAFAAAFGVGTLVADLDADGIYAGFPGDLFVVLVGVTYLFAIARANGTTDWLVHAAVRLVRGRVALIPWVMFALTGALTAIGAVSPAAVAIVAPVALSFATRYSISPLLMGTMVVHGAQAGGFSPISIYGSIVNGIVEREKLPGSEIGLFLASLAANLLIAAVLFAVLPGPGGHRQRRPRRPRQRDDSDDSDDSDQGVRRVSSLFPALTDGPAGAHAGRPALRFGERALTYGELAAAAGAVAGDLKGVRRAAVWATPTLETAVAVTAARSPEWSWSRSTRSPASGSWATSSATAPPTCSSPRPRASRCPTRRPPCRASTWTRPAAPTRVRFPTTGSATRRTPP
ncbi:hypothetical protein STENM223S_05953 [Streptomyces tendae]